MADDYDFEEEIFNPIKNLSREVGKELGLNISSEDFISFERKGKNKVKRVENYKIKVAIEVDMVCGIV